MQKKISDRLVWVDLEMTGLNPDSDVVLEIATLITDNNLEIIAQGPSLVIHQSEEKLLSMNQVVRQMHDSSGLTKKVTSSEITLAQAEQQTLDFIKKHIEKKASPLCGNSIYMDRMFIKRYMPKLDDYLHYRNLDVSSIKEVVLRWYQNDPRVEFEKKKPHRALDDIKESIEELKYYRSNFFAK